MKSGAGRGATSFVPTGAATCGSASTTATRIRRGADNVTAAVTQHMPVHVQSSCELPLWWCPLLLCVGELCESWGRRPADWSQFVPA